MAIINRRMGGPRSDGEGESRCGAMGRGLTRGRWPLHGGFGMKWRTRVGQHMESLADGGKTF